MAWHPFRRGGCYLIDNRGNPFDSSLPPPLPLRAAPNLDNWPSSKETKASHETTQVLEFLGHMDVESLPVIKGCLPHGHGSQVYNVQTRAVPLIINTSRRDPLPFRSRMEEGRGAAAGSSHGAPPAPRLHGAPTTPLAASLL